MDGADLKTLECTQIAKSDKIFHLPKYFAHFFSSFQLLCPKMDGGDLETLEGSQIAKSKKIFALPKCFAHFFAVFNFCAQNG
jgi:hypothetical protein